MADGNSEEKATGDDGMTSINNTEYMRELKIKVIIKKLDKLYRYISWDKEQIKWIENRLTFLKSKEDANG